MADNNDRPPTTSSPHNQSSEHVNLRVTYLLTGNPRPPHSLGRVALDTTVGMLKERIRTELPEHPLPQDQRLIYQGRPLLRNEVTLRQILRLENNTPTGPLPYTLHIIIQPSQHPPQLPQPSDPQPVQAAQHPPPVQRPNPITAAQTSASGLQDALSRIQRSIEMNRADLRSVQQRIAMQHHGLVIPPPPGQPFQNGQAVPMPLHLPQLPGIPPNFFPGPINIPTVQATLEQHHQHLRHPDVPVWPPNPHNPYPLGQPGPHAHADPSVPTSEQVQANTSARITSPSHHQVQEFQAPNGERMTVVTDHMSVRLPFQRPASAPGQPSTRPNPIMHSTNNPPAVGPQAHQAGQLPRPTAPHVHLPQQPLPSLHLPYPFAHTRPASTQASATTAWIVSSPSGPQALLFAPNHGYFSSANNSVQPASSTSNISTTVGNASRTIGNTTSPARQPPTRLDEQINENANRALIRQDQRPAVPALAQAQQNREDNDLFTFLIQRGWLFLRLYLFMFVFSEPGTWKRWIMIILATIICLQPRNGPLTRALTAARLHFDNLIGPPAQRPPQEPAARRRLAQDNQRVPDANATTDRAAQRPAHVRGAIQMTPEEAAARLIRDHQNQNPSFWRNALYRVEQSTALFLASLIPGVGERHVRAREEARREAQRLEEEERRRVEEEEVATSQRDGQASGQDDGVSSLTEAHPEVKVEGPPQPGNSSGIQVRDTATSDNELRSRAT